jgi:SDR family mycofactocin-dependent oxidoreductase
MDRLRGKVALVTGAARGQGRSHCVRMAEEGADIIAIDICEAVPEVHFTPSTDEDLAETVRLVEQLDRRIVATKADVRDRRQMRSAIDEGVNSLGRLDAVVANAGVGIISEWDKVTPEVWETTLAINLTGVWNTAQLAAPHLITSGGGSIVMTSSVAGLKAQPFCSHYVASKHGVVGIMRALAMELAEHNVRVNCVHPTGVETPMAESVAEIDELIAAHPKLGPVFTNLLPVELVKPVDISNAVLFLASDEARYVTGLTMTVDAGSTGF